MIKIPRNKESKRFREQNLKKNKRKLLSFIFFALLLGANIISIYIFQEINFHRQNSSNGVITPRQPRGSSVYYEDTTGEAHGVFISGDYAYIGDYDYGLAVIDITDPTNPGLPVYEDTDDRAYGVYVSGDYAYVADGLSGLAVIDISDPTNPGSPIYENTNGFAFSVFVSGDYAYVACLDYGLAVIDISDPTDPGAPVYRSTSGWAEDVYISGDYAYLACLDYGLAVIDISDPTNPGVPVYRITDSLAYGVYVSGDYAYLANQYSGLAVINISDPTVPGLPIYEDTADYASDVYVYGDFAYVTDRNSGLAIINISDPTDPGTPVYEDTIGYAWVVYVDGDYAYIANDDEGLAVIDISRPIDPKTPIHKDTTGSARNLYVNGDYAYVADRGSGLAVIDISDPTNPGTPVYEDTSAWANNVYVSGDYAYVSDDFAGLAVIDISDPTDPGAPIYENTAGTAYGVCVSGDYAYVADYESGLAVIDISNPNNPGTPVYENTVGLAVDVFISGDYAYVADLGSGLAVIDISNPTNPKAPVYEPTIDSATSVYVSGDYAYVACYPKFAIIDISDPTNPGTPVYVDMGGFALGVFVSGDYAYISDELLGLAVIDISDPTNPGAPVYESSISPFGLFVDGIYAYLADQTSGLAVIQVREIIDRWNPVITEAPSDFSVEYGYIGESLSWTATDANPNTYNITLEGTGVVAGPISWSSGIVVTYNIPDGFAVGDYIYTINFTDTEGNYNTDSVIFTVEDSTNPVIIDTPIDMIVEAGYTGQSLSWTATDANPNTYNITLEGTGVVAGPISWSSGIAVTYNIPDGFAVGDYIYTINFTDTEGNYNTDSVIFTVEDTNNPVITDAPSDFSVEYDYIGESLSWTATDANPNTYTIELEATGIVAGPTAWTSGIAITYDIPDGLDVGVYVYTINFTDTEGNYKTDSVNFTVEDTTNPVITDAPSDLTIEYGYTGVSLSWTATDANPDTYTITLEGTGIVAGPTLWSSGIAITYNIPDGLDVGVYVYTINFTDTEGNYKTVNVTFTVEDTTNPVITDTPTDLTVEEGYTAQNLSWIATDANPNTYTIELEGTGIVAGPTAWTSGGLITYDIPDGLSPGVYTYIITFIDESGNTVSDTVVFTVEEVAQDGKGGISFGNYYILFTVLSIIGVLIFIKRKKIH